MFHAAPHTESPPAILETGLLASCMEGSLDALSTGVRPPPSDRLDITFENYGDRLIGLGLVNAFLKILSLGLYSFWGKTEVRKRLWSFTRLNGEPLEYTGTGRELFLGFLVVFAAFVLPGIVGAFAVALLFPKNPLAANLYTVGLYVLFFFLIGNAVYRATRYRLSRTRWRGIRGSLDGSPWSYGWTYFWTLAVPALLALGVAAALFNREALEFMKMDRGDGSAILLGLMASRWSILALIAGVCVISFLLPWRSNLLQSKMTNAMRFGSQPLTYTGTAGPLYKNYVFAITAVLVLFGLAVFATLRLAEPNLLAGDFDLDAPEPGPSGFTFGRLMTTLIWLGWFLALTVIMSWYRANQMNHFARHTHFGTARFEGLAKGGSLAWLSLSNWLLVMLATLLAIIVGGAVMFVSIFNPGSPAELTGLSTGTRLMMNISILIPMIFGTTVATTFAQFRSARYFMSRLKLNGPVDLTAIQQNASTQPKRGEGLAQVFDLDAF